jgi:hypothetical protein
VLQATPVICPRLPNVVAVAVDGSTVISGAFTSGIIFQYCATDSTTLCAPPFTFYDLPIPIDPRTPMLGGNPAPAAATRTLYVQSDTQVNKVYSVPTLTINTTIVRRSSRCYAAILGGQLWGRLWLCCDNSSCSTNCVYLVAPPGLEPGLSALKGPRVNQLHHGAAHKNISLQLYAVRNSQSENQRMEAVGSGYRDSNPDCSP